MTCIRGFGLGFSIMPLMTYGLASLPPELTNAGSALMNVARQCGGAFGLAALSALSTSQEAQLFADRGAIMPPSTAPTPPAGSMTPQIFASAYGKYLSLSSQVMSVSFANLFLIIAGITGSGILLAVFIRTPAKGSGDATSAAAGAH